ncbi:hypothetical protein LRS03_02980 [Rhizobacter sp. J219]|uniref:hypothetical protein n=1 Tax=Rhizobacter sp. J219 TaxID=2898430 RepID=UPI0021511FC9|nr:hypothetical protein [Rhizobacter sp. J219]MCR5881876.1 hypothetical protein [Rhizobacter sp. J219]
MASPMSPARKRIAMLIVAVGSVLLVQRVVALSGDETPEPAPAPVKRERASAGHDRGAAPAAAQVQLDRLVQRTMPAASAASSTGSLSLFDVVAWEPPPPKVTAPPPPPPKPAPPPFPYAYMGGLSEDGVRTAFFMKGERVLPVKAGDVVDAAFRVDEMNDKQMTVTYLPMNETLSVPLEGGR